MIRERLDTKIPYLEEHGRLLLRAFQPSSCLAVRFWETGRLPITGAMSLEERTRSHAVVGFSDAPAATT
jgi:hypothetical protein